MYRQKNESIKWAEILFTAIILFFVLTPHEALADIKIDENDIKAITETESLDTEGVPIFTDYSLELREKHIKKEQNENESILSNLFLGKNLFGTETLSGNDETAKMLFDRPAAYKKDDEDGRVLKDIAIYIGYIVAVAALIYTSIKLTRKARRRFKKEQV